MKVRWSQAAWRDLRRIHTYISEDSEAAANNLVKEIVRAVQRLEVFPRSGRAIPEYDDDQALREIIVSSYRVLYRLRASSVDILAIIHGTRVLFRTPPEFE